MQRKALFPFNAVLLDSVEKYISHAGGSEDSQQTISGRKRDQHRCYRTDRIIAFRDADFLQNGATCSDPPLVGGRKKYLSSCWITGRLFSEKSPAAGSHFGAVTAFYMLIRRKELEKVKTVLQFIYRTDVYISVAQVANKRQFVFPVAYPRGSNILKATGVYHPELKVPVANDLHHACR